MRIAFVVNSVETEQPAYTTTRLALAAARRGHETWLMGVDDFLHQLDGSVNPANTGSLVTGAPTGSVLSGNDWPWISDARVQDSGNHGAAGSPPRGWLTGPGGVAAANEFATTGSNDGAAEMLVLTRASGGPGLAGVWQGRRVVGDATAEYSAEGDRLRVHLSPSEERWFAPLDGKDHPWLTPGVVPGDVTAAGRQTGPRTISFVLKEEGVPFHFATLAVSPDGKTLQIDQVHGATATAPERSQLVYERK